MRIARPVKRAVFVVCLALLGCGRGAETEPETGPATTGPETTGPETTGPETTGPETQTERGRTLFDGSSLAGWEGDPRYWSVEDGELVGRSRAEEPLERSTYLVWSGAELRDFELSLAYRLVRGNSGVQFRSRVVGAHNVAGYQADLADEQGLTGSLYEQFGRGTLAGRGERTQVAGTGKSERARFAEEAELARSIRAGEWNELRIRAVGERCELWINGVRTCELLDQSPKLASRSGCLALQLHSGPPMEVRFRAIRLVELGGEHDARERLDPCWIWSHARAGADEEAWFQRTLELAQAPRKATLYAVADDGFEAYLNGVLVAAGEGTEKTQQVDVSERVRAGTNVLALWARNIDGPAALLATLHLEGDGWQRLIATDSSWRAARTEPRDWLSSADDSAWQVPHSFGPIGTEPWPRPSNQVKHARLSALEGEKITVPEGFVCELVYSVPRARQGSWVALTFDDAGRAYAADQHGFLYRLELSPGGPAERVERVPVELGEAQGLCWAFDSLYVVVNRSQRFESGLYRVTDSDGDDRLDRVELLRAFEGNDEHGPHAVVQAFDDLYVVGGYEVAPPAEALAEWGASFLPVGRLPAAVQRVELTEFELAQQGATGWVARTDRDGKEWRLVAVGLRNAYDLAFDRSDLLYAFDSDMEWDLGMPWYVPTRIVEIVGRGDYGFRLGSARWPTWFPDSERAVVDVGRSSPTGMLSGRALAFPDPYRDAIFCGDWLKGRIFAFFPASSGEETARVEEFASGKPLPVTDLADGPEGMLYFTTGGRHAQSGLYRIRALGKSGEARGESYSPLLSGFDLMREASLETNRRALGRPGSLSAARAALESRPIVEWAESSESEPDARIRAQLELSLARVGPPERVAKLLGAMAERAIDPKNLEEARLALRTLELALLRAAPVASEVRARLAERLLAVFPSEEIELDRQLGVLLASLPEAEERFVPLALAKLAQNGIDAEGFHWALVLRHATRGWTSARREQYFEWLRAADEGFGGGRSVPMLLEALRKDAVATLGEAERAALGGLVERRVEGGFAPTEARRFVRAWTAAELEPALARFEEQRDLVRGAKLLREASCLTCHRIEGRGIAVGPELDGLAGRFSGGDLLASLLEPSREVPDRFRDTEIRMRDGRLLVGKIVGGSAADVLLKETYGRREVVRLERAEIESQELSRTSPMPEGLLDSLELEEVLDLMAYLLQDG